MDDDPFSSSVWGSPDPVAPLSQPFSAPTFDDFDDDFAEPAPTATAEIVDDDDFGDFGDFGDAEVAPDTSFGTAFEDAAPLPPIATGWTALRLDPMPDKDDLREQVDAILAPVWRHGDATTDEAIREAEGINQILVTPQSRELYTMLLKSPPPTKPPNWTRSRIRRQHLITLGIPVNLDEVLPPQANGHAMPHIQVSTRPMSAPPGPHKSGVAGGLAPTTPRSGTPQPGGRAEQFGPKPEIDNAKIAQLLALDAATLAIQPLGTLEGYLAALRAQTASTSTLLSHLLQTRDSLQQDSETYNKLIAELVGEAQKIKTSGRNPTRKGSGMSMS
ncbi:hypothetical protein HMN09_01409000 [Mycena chlorophos]|uniref:Uncharacterized protein n=1 Tax=Mycena chlorophos TaxID=658473 RepID=A0A8H6RVW5_MYCCL|nr:hypothetical protein HMN09_01409000 [Mycena chlorophos]